jgi:hypothetical protein
LDAHGGNASLARRYEEIDEATRSVRRQSLSEIPPIERAHAAIDEIRLWQAALRDRPEAIIFDQVIGGLEVGIFALVSGLYRQAYGSLRLAVELVAGMCWFSTHRLDLAEWQTGEKDLVWRDITNPDEGILSPRYRKAFFPELRDEKRYNGLNLKLYRELSEHVHGNVRTWSSNPNDIVFDRALHDEWLNKLETFMLVMNVTLSIRYLQEVPSQHLPRLDAILRFRIPQAEAIMKFLDDRLISEAAMEQLRAGDAVGMRGAADQSDVFASANSATVSSSGAQSTAAMDLGEEQQ